jgi:hypothetical protein
MVIKKTIEEPLEEIDSVKQDTEPSFGIEPVEQIQASKPKKVLNENQRKAVAANLKKGREALAKKQEQQRLDREARKEELLNVKQETILKKAENIKKVQQKKIDKTKAKISKIIDIPDVEYDEEETIITKKPKKKRVIYKEESDSEEEVIVKKMPKQKPVVNKIPLLQFF